MPFKKGDFIQVNYVAKVKETGETFDTTLEEIAKKERLYKEGEVYEPKLIVIGEGWVLEALDDSLQSLQLKKPRTIEIPPNKAFGARDPEKLKMVPMRRLRDKGITPQLGLRIEYEKRLATIRTLGAGRVTLDFNPPLAGKTLIYEITAQKKLRTKKEKIASLIHRRIPLIDIVKFKLDPEKTCTTIQIPEEAFYIEGLQIAKRGIATDIKHFFPTTVKVNFLESFESPTPATKSKERMKKKQETLPRKKSQKTSAK